jgi:hypothetical protein
MHASTGCAAKQKEVRLLPNRQSAKDCTIYRVRSDGGQSRGRFHPCRDRGEEKLNNLILVLLSFSLVALAWSGG